MKDYSNYGGYNGYDGYNGYNAYGDYNGFRDGSRRGEGRVGGDGNGYADGGRRDGAYGNRGYDAGKNARGFDTYREGAKDSGARGAGGFGEVPPDMQNRVEQYSSMSRSELSDELMREAAALRSQGLLDVNRLDEFCRMAAPYMSAEQVRRMREIIDMLR